MVRRSQQWFTDANPAMDRLTARSCNSPSRLTRWLGVLCLALALVVPFAGEAQAGPPANAKGSASTSRAASGSSSGSGSGFKLPDFVYGGNAVSMLAPIQVGLTPNGYIPRGRIGFQYDRQMYKAHWLHVGAAVLFDRGDWSTFRMDSCGLENEVGTCQPGGTAGMDIWLGYTYKLFIEAQPWIVPYFRTGIAGGFWYYPRLGGTREQTRELSWMLGIQAGVGIRFFLLRELAIGFDLELRPGFAVHRELAAGATEPDNDPAFILPLQILPLTVEWRF